MKGLVGSFNQDKAYSVIVKSSRSFVGSLSDHPALGRVTGHQITRTYSLQPRLLGGEGRVSKISGVVLCLDDEIVISVTLGLRCSLLRWK